MIGLEDRQAWALVTKVAFDSMPAQRRTVIQHLQAAGETTTKKTAIVLGVPTTTARRTLEDLAAHGVTLRSAGKQPGEADTWTLAAGIAVPEMSEHPSIETPHTAFDDFSGTGHGA